MLPVIPQICANGDPVQALIYVTIELNHYPNAGKRALFADVSRLDKSEKAVVLGYLPSASRIWPALVISRPFGLSRT
jgi:hypothetical protein